MSVIWDKAMGFPCLDLEKLPTSPWAEAVKYLESHLPASPLVCLP